jgi:hypothetical protein
MIEENRAMTGIQYVTDEQGRKVAVQIDLTRHRELWEDIEDVLLSRSRKNEKRIPLDKLKAELVKSGKVGCGRAIEVNPWGETRSLGPIQ